ncbi:flagellar protein FlaG [Paenibacillus puerhi]|uniref:flagellar protein FlaG n=1 Tax=Paenibacillus puerhi TaxID=2692622 RepID=UPI0013581BE5|nr:flagellar protein FlaG [Paenibacillus puerhi]
MSGNLPISTSGYGVDRVPTIEGGARPRESYTDTGSTTSPSVSGIANSADLKLAELRGEKYTISDEQLIKAIERAVKAMQGKATSLEFSVHKKTNLISVKVLDKETGDVIREIPPEKTLDLVANLWRMAGIMVDERG